MALGSNKFTSFGHNVVVGLLKLGGLAWGIAAGLGVLAHFAGTIVLPILTLVNLTIQAAYMGPKLGAADSAVHGSASAPASIAMTGFCLILSLFACYVLFSAEEPGLSTAIAVFGMIASGVSSGFLLRAQLHAGCQTAPDGVGLCTQWTVVTSLNFLCFGAWLAIFIGGIFFFMDEEIGFDFDYSDTYKHWVISRHERKQREAAEKLQKQQTADGEKQLPQPTAAEDAPENKKAIEVV